MRQLKTFAVFVPVLLALSGCSADREAAITGSWRARPQAMVVDVLKANPNMTPSESQEMGRQLGQQLSGVSLDMNADKTWVMRGNRTINGTWTFSTDTGTATLSAAPPPPDPGAIATPAPALGAGSAAPAPPKGAVYSAKLDGDNTRITVDVPTRTLDLNLSLPDIVFVKADAQ